MSVTFIQSGRFTSTAFSPPDFANLRCWFDASVAGDFTFGTGSKVAQWNDKSGNGHHVAQATAGLQPDRSGTQNGLSTVVFDGTDDQLQTTNYDVEQRCTIFAVVNATDTAQSKVLVSCGNNDYLLYATSAEAYTGYLDNNFTNQAISATGQTGPKVVVARWHAADRRIRVNGVETTGTNTCPSGTATDLAIGYDLTGGALPFNGALAELIIYLDSAAAISDPNIAVVEAYLNAKWAVY